MAVVIIVFERKYFFEMIAMAVTESIPKKREFILNISNSLCCISKLEIADLITNGFTIFNKIKGIR